jgi:hypothetical protein
MGDLELILLGLSCDVIEIYFIETLWKPFRFIYITYFRKKMIKMKTLILRKNMISFKFEGIDETCSICLQEIKAGEASAEMEWLALVADRTIIRTPCNHFYHAFCLSKWLKAKKTCPIDNNTL